MSLEEEQKPPFNTKEIRVLGSLMEKQLTTANNYPLTINSLMLACNQKSSREPVMNLTEGEVGNTARGLIEFGFTVLQNSGRAQRVEHKVDQQFKLNQKQQAILAVLMLRRPQTLSEIKARTERMADFDSVDEIQNILDAWIEDEQPLVMRLPAGNGHRTERYFHLLGEETPEAIIAAEASATPTKTTRSNSNPCEALEARVDALEKRLTELEAQLS